MSDDAPTKRRPCPTCPWRKSTPKRGFPGGFIDAERLMDMLDVPGLRVMQCHSTPDDHPLVCVGFAMQIGFRSVGLRFMASAGRFSSGAFESDEELHDLVGVIRKHGGRCGGGRR